MISRVTAPAAGHAAVLAIGSRHEAEEELLKERNKEEPKSSRQIGVKLIGDAIAGFSG